LNAIPRVGYSAGMSHRPDIVPSFAVTPSRRTLHAELLRLCARIGYSPPRLA
jgi:hypothetical protein